MKNGGPALDVLETAKSHAVSFSTPARRAQQILTLLMQDDVTGKLNLKETL